MKTVDGAILAGGLSRRMAGQNKALLPYRGKPMVQWVAEALRPAVHKILLSCNRDQEQFRNFADTLHGDLIPGFKGPLSGLHALLSHTEADYLLTASCDTPLLKPDYARQMLAALKQDLDAGRPAATVYCARSQDKEHPLHLLISKACLKSLTQALAADHLRVMEWLNAQSPKYVEFSDQAMFSNFNRPQDLEQES